MARSVSAMPGPWSRAITSKPRCCPRFTIRSTISPLPAYETMLRATSDMAVAMSVNSLPEKRQPDNRPRALWRATTTSTSAFIETISSFRVIHCDVTTPPVSDWSKSRPSSRSSAVVVPSSVRPNCTIEKATSGWIPTIIHCAPSSLTICAMPRIVRTANESITSNNVTSTSTPVDR